MNWITSGIVGLLLLLILCLIRKCSINIEGFSQQNDVENLLHNSSFQNGNDIQETVHGCSHFDTIKIVKMPDNPIHKYSQHVLKQSSGESSNPNYYLMNVKLMPGYNYCISAWCSHYGKWGNDQLFSIQNIRYQKTCQSEPVLNVRSMGIIDKKMAGNMEWYQIQYTFNVPNDQSGDTLIYLGCFMPNQVKGVRYLTNIVLKPYLPMAMGFPRPIGLMTYLDGRNKNSYDGNGMIWSDLSNMGNNFKWKNTPAFDMNVGYFKTVNNTLYGPASNNFGLKDQFTIMVLSQNKNSSNKFLPINLNNFSAITLSGNQEVALDIMMPNNYGNIVLLLNGQKFITDKKIVPELAGLYSFVYNQQVIEIYFNDTLLEVINNVPRLYFDDGPLMVNKSAKWDTNLYAFLVYNKALQMNAIKEIYNCLKNYGSCIKKDVPALTVKPMTDIKSMPISIESVEEQEEELMPLDMNKMVNKIRQNLKKECMGKNTSACQQYCKMYKNDPICMIKPMELETTQCPAVYMKDGGYHVYIPKNSKFAQKMGTGERNYGKNKDTVRNIYKLNFPGCPVPDILRATRPSHQDCPFVINKHNPCNAHACRNVNWKAKNPKDAGFNRKCRKHVSNYCTQFAYQDPNCKCWQDEVRGAPDCQKYRRHFESPEDYGCSVNVFDITEHTDFKNYIRKDKIPCWNCNLTAPTPKDSVMKRRTWKS